MFRRTDAPKETYEETEPELKPSTAKVVEDQLWAYNTSCYFKTNAEGNIEIVWDNGLAFETTKGGAKDYIPAHMKMTLTEDMTHYGFFEDYERMVAGKVDPKLAWIMCTMRQTSMGLLNVSVSAAEVEIIRVAHIKKALAIDPAVLKMLTEAPLVVDSIIQQTFSIFCLNAISLIGRGHHYSEDDNMWARLTNATNLDNNFALLKINNWEGMLFHDLCHPFDIDWMTKLVADPKQKLVNKVNGVVSKRWNVVPAGATAVQLFAAAADIVKFKNNELYTALIPALNKANILLADIHSRPLDYCIHLPRGNTNENLQKAQAFEPLVAFIAGYLKALGGGKYSVLAAKSVGNIIQRNTQYHVLGAASTDAFGATAASKGEVITTLGVIVANLG